MPYAHFHGGGGGVVSYLPILLLKGVAFLNPDHLLNSRDLVAVGVGEPVADFIVFSDISRPTAGDTATHVCPTRPCARTSVARTIACS